MSASRILHCLRAPVGGLFRHVRDLATEQARRGYEVGIVCDSLVVDSLTESRLQELDAGVTLGVHRVAMARGIGLGDYAAFRAVRKLMQAMQIDVAHGHGAKGGAHARLAARALRKTGQMITTIYTPHGGTLNYTPGTAAARLFMELERQLASCTDGIVFESAFAQRRYVESVGGAKLRQQVVFNGLTPDEFHVPIQNSDATDLLFIGELRDLKGVDVLIQALSLVRKSRKATLTIVGEGRDRAKLTSLVDRLGLADAIRLVGAKPAREAFEMGAVVVVPSRKESLPYVVLEAAAAGLPVIATDVGGINEIVAGTNTELIPSDDAERLAAAIEHTLGHPADAVARARELRERVETSFTVKTMTDAISAFYAECSVTDPAVRSAA